MQQYPPYPPYQIPPPTIPGPPKQKLTLRGWVAVGIIAAVGLVVFWPILGELVGLALTVVMIGGLVWLFGVFIRIKPVNSYQVVEPVMSYEEVQESTQDITYNTYNVYNNCIIQQNFYYGRQDDTYIEEECEEDEDY